MATMLESYISQKNGFYAGLGTAMPSADSVLRQQELLYRIDVLETCRMFIMTAPKSADPSALQWHYHMVDAYLNSLPAERRIGARPDEHLTKQRETALGNLNTVIHDYRKRFCSFAPGGDADCYRKTIANVVQTVLPVWTQYRQTYIEIPKGDA